MTTLKANGQHQWGDVQVAGQASGGLSIAQPGRANRVELDSDQEEALRNLLNARAIAAVEALPKPSQPGELRVGDRVRVRADRRCEVRDCPMCEGRPVLLVEKLLPDGALDGGPMVMVTGGYSAAISYLERVP